MAQTGQQTIARRYATAFFELATEQKAIDQISADMDAIAALVSAGGDVQTFLENDSLSRAAQTDALLAVAKHLKLSPLSEKLLGTLAQNRRLQALGAVVADIQRMIAEQKGEVTAEVTAAQALDQAQIDAIASALSKSVGKKVHVDLSIDPAIMGGLVIKVGSQLIDSSVRTKLDRLHRALKNTNNSTAQKKMKEVA